MLLHFFDFLREKHAQSPWYAHLTTMLTTLPFALLLVLTVDFSGGEGFLFGFLVYVVGHVSVDHALSTRQERTNRLKDLKRGLSFIVENYMFVIAHLIGVIGLLLFFSMIREEPKNPWVSEIYAQFKTLTDLVVVLLVMCAMGRMVFEAGRNRESVPDLINSLVVDTIVLVTALAGITALIGNYGDDAYAYYQNDPEKASATLVALAMLGIALSFKRFIGNPLRMRHHEGEFCSAQGQASAQFSKPKPAYDMSAKSIENTAYHEAGHALFFACLKPYPHNMALVVRGDYKDSALGYVTGLGQFELDPTKSMMEWSMLRYLAGDRASLIFKGESNSGAGSDHHKWLLRAQRYLEEQYRGTYYAKPSNMLEQQSNNAIIDTLRNEQYEIVDRFLRANALVVEDIVGEVLSSDEMELDRKQLAEFMDRVVITDGIPVIKN